MAARVLLIIAAIAAASILIIQVPAKSATSILDQIPSLRRTSSNKTDADADDVFDDVRESDDERDLQVATTSSSDNIFAHQQRSSGYGYGNGYTSSPYTNNYWTNTGGYTKGYTVYNQQHQQKYSSGGYKYPTGSYQTGYKYPSYPTYNTGRYPVARPKPRPSSFGRIKKWNGGRKKRKKQSCYVKCCRKMRGRRNKKKKCRRRCRKKNSRPKNPCNMNPCPKYPCGTNPCPKKKCPGETITTCARICSSNDGCAFFGFVLGSIQCNLWTAYCEPICQLGRGPPTPLPPTPAPPTPRPPTQSISSRIASGQCECTPALGDQDNTIDLLGRLILSANDEESSLVVSFNEPPDQDDSPPLPPPAQQSQATPAQTYFIPLREEDLGESFTRVSNTNGGSSCGNPTEGNDRRVSPTTSIATSIPGTVLWVDHWEDGYETAITDPSSRKPSTLVLGDGNPFNGCIEKFRKEASGTCNYQCTSRDTDYIEAGEAILLRNLDSQCRERKIDTRNNARDFSKQSASRPPPLYFDGSDIVYSSFPIAMTKIEIPGQQGGNLAGGVEITDSKNYGTTFTIPVGRDSDPSAQNKRTPGGPKYNDAFELSEAHVMASQDFTRVELRDVDGTLVGNPVTLQKGESHVFSNVKKGQQVVAKSPVQVDLITGDLRCTHRANVYEMRWFALTPDRDRSNTYVTPVSTDGTDTTRVWLYNPSTSAIRVYYKDSTGSERSIQVPAKGNANVLTKSGTGTRFSTCQAPVEAKDCTGAEFTAISITDAGTSQIPTAGGDSKDWGAPLQPATQLTSQALIGLGWGCPSNKLPCTSNSERRCPSDTKHLCCRKDSSGTGRNAAFSTSQSNSYTKTQNPVWVTPTQNACIFVDFDGPDSNLRDVKHIYVEALDQLLVTDCVDNDMTGAVIYATEPNGGRNCDQVQKDKPVDIAVAWGQKPDLATSGALDLGTTVLALPTVGVSKSVLPDRTLAPGEPVRYTIRVTNTGVVDLPADEFNLYDNSAVFFQHATYNPGSTTYRVESSGGSGSVGPIRILDSSSGTAFPLDDQTNGYTIPVGLNRGDAFVIQYDATVKGDALTGQEVINSGLLLPKDQQIPTDPSVIGKIPPAQKFSVQNPIFDPTPAPVVAADTSPPSKTPSASPSRSPSTSPSSSPTRSPSASPSSTPSTSPSAGPSKSPSAGPSSPPSTSPSNSPTSVPSAGPSRIPSAFPSAVPSTSPSLEPSGSPSSSPSLAPSSAPSSSPSTLPSLDPSSEPSRDPSESPSDVPSKMPSMAPSVLPSSGPSDQPSRDPSESPSDAPSKMPSSSPSLLPSSSPSSEPSRDPSESPSKIPSESPSLMPSATPSSNPSVSSMPSAMPSSTPSSNPSSEPSLRPSGKPTNPPSVSFMPSGEPSSMPSSEPSSSPSSSPSVSPSSIPSSSPSDAPSLTPSVSPSIEPSSSPSSQPSSLPSSSPSDLPSLTPSVSPSSEPSLSPSSQPSAIPSSEPSSEPSSAPSLAPSPEPSSSPSDEPSSQPSSSPSSQPSASPSTAPSLQPSSMPSRLPSLEPSSTPSLRPSSAPSADPSAMPSAAPSASPSLAPSPIPSSSPSSMPSTSPSKSPSARPSLRPSKDPSSAPSSSPSSSPSTSPPTFAPITPFPTPFPTDEPTLPPYVNIQTTCAYSYEIFTDSVPPSPFLVYQYKFRTDSTSCLFVKVQTGYTFEGQLKTVCHGFIRGTGTGEEVLIPDSLCTTARFPSTNTNSPISVVIKYGLAPESECSDSPPASQCTDCSTSLNQEIFSGVSRACEAPEEIAPGEVSLNANEEEGGDYYVFFGGDR